MNGIDGILGSLRAESEEKIKNIKAEAEKSYNEIVSNAQKDADLLSKKIKADAEAEAADILKRGESKAELEEKNIILAKKQELVKKTVFSAKERLENAEDKEYFLFLKKLVEKSMPNQNGEIILSKKDKERANSDFLGFLKEKNLVISDKELKQGEMGFVISYGDVLENCTLNSVFSAEYEALSDKAAEILFK